MRAFTADVQDEQAPAAGWDAAGESEHVPATAGGVGAVEAMTRALAVELAPPTGSG